MTHPDEPRHTLPVDRWRLSAVLLGPLILLAAFAWHPFIGDMTDDHAAADALAADTDRWFLSHLALAIGGAVLLLGFLAIQAHVRENVGDSRWIRRGTPFIVFGSVLFAMAPAMEIGVLAAHEAGQDAAAVQTALGTWFVPIFMGGSLIFLVGTVAFATGIVRSRLLGTGTARLVAGAMVVMVLARFVPASAALLVSGLAGIVAFWPIAFAMQRGAPAAQARGIHTRGPDA